jgi:putative membrane protein
VLATILVGDVKRGADALTTFATPLIGAFIMVLWDMTLDPAASTIGNWWIWHQGGGFFGVPLQNFLGWFLTVFVFMQVFALYLRARGPEQVVSQPKDYFLQAIAMYAVVALDFVVNYAVKHSETVVDATGIAWRSGDILETSAICALLTMMFIVALATITVLREPAATAR